MPSVRIKEVHHDGLMAAALLCCFCISLAAFAQDSLPKTKPAGYVNDFAGVLSHLADANSPPSAPKSIRKPKRRLPSSP